MRAKAVLTRPASMRWLLWKSCFRTGIGLVPRLHVGQLVIWERGGHTIHAIATSLVPRPSITTALGDRRPGNEANRNLASFPGLLLWHSKADKIVNNFHGQNRFQFHGQIPIYGQNSHFCCQNWFFNVQTYKFSCQITKYLGQSPFHSNAKISCSTLFHSNFMLNSVPFQQHFMVSHDFMVSDSLDLPAPDVSHAFLLNFGVVWVFIGNSYNTSPTM